MNVDDTVQRKYRMEKYVDFNEMKINIFLS